jgi:hypothetical protein
VKLHLRDRTFEAEQEAAIGRARVVDPVAIADEALAIATQIQQRIPI